MPVLANYFVVQTIRLMIKIFCFFKAVLKFKASLADSRIMS